MSEKNRIDWKIGLKHLDISNDFKQFVCLILNFLNFLNFLCFLILEISLITLHWFLTAMASVLKHNVNILFLILFVVHLTIYILILVFSIKIFTCFQPMLLPFSGFSASLGHIFLRRINCVVQVDTGNDEIQGDHLNTNCFIFMCHKVCLTCQLIFKST